MQFTKIKTLAKSLLNFADEIKGNKIIKLLFTLKVAFPVDLCPLHAFNMDYMTRSNMTTTGLRRKKQSDIWTHFHYHETEKKNECVAVSWS